MAQIIDGSAFAKEIRGRLMAEVEAFRRQTGDVPGLAVVLVGDDPASQVYVRNKEKACHEVGMDSWKHHLPESASVDEVLTVVDRLNRDPQVNGILVQLPLPKRIDSGRVLAAVDPGKDVDGFHTFNLGKLLAGQATLVACTPKGIIELLKRSNVELSGSEAVVLGRSITVGKPIALLLLQEDATVTICHSKTKNLDEVLSRADIVIAAVGKPQTVTGDMVKDGVVVIDVGINRVGDKLVGDVDFDSVAPKARAITPVPGGVGPMTIAMLLENTLIAAREQARVAVTVG